MRHSLEIIADKGEEEDHDESIVDDGNVLISQKSFAVLSPRLKRPARKEPGQGVQGINTSTELRKLKLGMRRSLSMEEIQMFKDENL